MGVLVLGISRGHTAARDFRQIWVINPNRFAAIAYSPSTGKYGYSYNYQSRSAAERVALEHLPQPDARIVCWVQAGFCALAKGDDKSEWGVGYSYGKGARTEDAREAAVEECGKRTTHPYLAVLLLSDGQLVWDHAPDNPAAQETRESGDAKTEEKQANQFPVQSATTPVQQSDATPGVKQLGKLSPSMMKSLASATDENRKSQLPPETGKPFAEKTNSEDKPAEKKPSLTEIFQFGDASKSASAEKQANTKQAQESAQAGSWQTSWDRFLTLAEQELNRSPAAATRPWDGKEVTWEGTVNDLEVMMAKNLIRLVFDMPERTLTIKGQTVTAGRLMIFVPMEYENLAAVKKGATVRFKTTIAPIDAAHPAVSAQVGKGGDKGFLLIFTKGGTLLK
jgi:Domain of unknown function (DUF4189)